MVKWYARAILAGWALIVFYLWVQLNLAANYAAGHAVPVAVNQNQHDGQTMLIVLALFVDLGLVVVAAIFIVPLIVRFGVWVWHAAELQPRDRHRGA